MKSHANSKQKEVPMCDSIIIYKDLVRPKYIIKLVDWVSNVYGIHYIWVGSLLCSLCQVISFQDVDFYKFEATDVQEADLEIQSCTVSGLPDIALC